MTRGNVCRLLFGVIFSILVFNLEARPRFEVSDTSTTLSVHSERPLTKRLIDYSWGLDDGTTTVVQFSNLTEGAWEMYCLGTGLQHYHSKNWRDNIGQIKLHDAVFIIESTLADFRNRIPEDTVSNISLYYSNIEEAWADFAPKFRKEMIKRKGYSFQLSWVRGRELADKAMADNPAIEAISEVLSKYGYHVGSVNYSGEKCPYFVETGVLWTKLAERSDAGLMQPGIFRFQLANDGKLKPSGDRSQKGELKSGS